MGAGWVEQLGLGARSEERGASGDMAAWSKGTAAGDKTRPSRDAFMRLSHRLSHSLSLSLILILTFRVKVRVKVKLAFSPRSHSRSR